MDQKIVPPEKKVLIRCPRLGHQIYFSYCCQENLGNPCTKTLDCWYQHFPVQEYLQEHLTKEVWADTFEKPAKPKMLSLVELIEQAKKMKN